MNTAKHMGMKLWNSITSEVIHVKLLFIRYYEGHLPVLVTSDLEIIEEIFFKQFSNFSARKVRYFDTSILNDTN